MRIRASGLCSGLLVTLAVAASPVAARSANALPSAHELLAKSIVSVWSKGSYRVRYYQVGTVQENTYTFRDIEDIALRPRMSREHVTITMSDANKSPAVTRQSSFEIVWSSTLRAGFRGAERVGAHGKWRCSGIDRIDILPTLTDIQLTSGKSLHTLGSETVGGTPVWHVHGQYSMQEVSVGPPQVDVYIAQADFTLVRETVSNGTDMETGNYSKYGEAVHVRLPALCRGVRRTTANTLSA